MVSQEDMANAINWLLSIGGVNAAAIVDTSNTIVYSTDNWDLTGDLPSIKKAWGGATFVMAMETKFSILQREETRFVATNFGGAGHLVSIKTTREPEYYVFAFLSPEEDARSLVMEAQRAGDMLYGIAEVADTGRVGGGGTAAAAPSAAPGIDPNVKASVDMFLNWIKDPNGFPAYIKYYLDANDQNAINIIAGIYEKFKQVFGF